MKTPRLDGIIERRLLLNYRLDPDIAATMVPAPFRPQLVRGHAVGGICLLRLGQLRPVGFPKVVGLRSENVAHRIAVEWDDGDQVRTGVYIERRDSGSWINVAAGGRLFPGAHHKARFTVDEHRSWLAVAVANTDGEAAVTARARVVSELRSSELFSDLAEATSFFERGSIGFSPGRNPQTYDAMGLSTGAWNIDALEVEEVTSSVFDDRKRFPLGTAVFDCGLLMREMPVQWREVTSELQATLVPTH